MWQSKHHGQANVVAPAIAAALSAVLCRKLATRPGELTSEILCWILLPLLFAITKSSKSQTASRFNIPFINEDKPDVSLVCSVFALGVAVASFCKAENGVIGFFVRFLSSFTRFISVNFFFLTAPSLPKYLFYSSFHAVFSLSCTAPEELRLSCQKPWPTPFGVTPLSPSLPSMHYQVGL